jgi:hypothetical protein
LLLVAAVMNFIETRQLKTAIEDVDTSVEDVQQSIIGVEDAVNSLRN